MNHEIFLNILVSVLIIVCCLIFLWGDLPGLIKRRWSPERKLFWRLLFPHKEDENPKWVPWGTYERALDEIASLRFQLEHRDVGSSTSPANMADLLSRQGPDKLREVVALERTHRIARMAYLDGAAMAGEVRASVRDAGWLAFRYANRKEFEARE